MTELLIITPTRGRPRQFAEMLAAVVATSTTGPTVLSLVDEDDPAGADYDRMTPPGTLAPRVRGPRQSLARWTNEAALYLPLAQEARYVASLGDDHRPRTHGWDRLLIDAIEAQGGTGIAYGNDLFQGPNMPTAWVMSTDIVRELGWMMLPGCEHMYVDAAILALGWAAGCITYRPDVIVEHVHPLAGKAAWDPSYRESNAPQRYAADKAAYEAWTATQLEADAARVAALRKVSTP